MKSEAEIRARIDLAEIDIKQGVHVIEQKQVIELLQWVLNDPVYKMPAINAGYEGKFFGYPVYEQKGLL